jgi:hypothetical protein
MKNIMLKLSCVLSLSIYLISCTDSSVTPSTANYVKVAEAVTTGSSFNVTMYETDSAFVGYNKTYFQVTDLSTGKLISQATLALHPLMNMGTMQHACPWENPTAIANPNGLFEGAVIFSMGGVNMWSVSVDVTANGKTENAKLNILKVAATNPVQKIVVVDSVWNAGVLTQTKYPISLVKSKDWQVGMNTFEITIHCQQDMMTFIPRNDFTVEITPEMPSMGHGSPNNINPVNTVNGHYVGNVNFTMTGAWRVHLLFKKSGRVVSSTAYFDITF